LRPISDLMLLFHADVAAVLRTALRSIVCHWRSPCSLAVSLFVYTYKRGTMRLSFGEPHACALCRPALSCRQGTGRAVVFWRRLPEFPPSPTYCTPAVPSQ
jgi:hypothetical protein